MVELARIAWAKEDFVLVSFYILCNKTNLDLRLHGADLHSAIVYFAFWKPREYLRSTIRLNFIAFSKAVWMETLSDK